MQLSRGQRRWLAAIAVLLIGGFFIARHLMAPVPVNYQTVKVVHRDLQQMSWQPVSSMRFVKLM